MRLLEGDEMTRTEELLAEATVWYEAHQLDVVPIQYVDLQQLIALCRLQHEAVRQYATMMPLWKAGVEALEAFNKFEQGDK